jgi:uncharacterized protein
MKIKKLVLICGIAMIMVLSIVLSACAASPALVYQSPSGLTAANSTSTGGIIVSQQSLGLWVNGLGKATATPDIVLLTLGIQSQASTVAQAQKAAVDSMNKVMQVLKSGGIADKDITTTQYTIQQLTRWDEKQNTNVILGYEISNMVTIKIRRIDKSGEIIDQVAESGGDLIRVNNISFSVDDPSPYFKIAREKAIQNAMETAKQMSEQSGLKLGKITYITEGTVYAPVAQNYMKFSAADGVAAAPTPISAGELEYQINVQIVYEIN